MDHRDVASCVARVGLLVLHKCGKAAAGRCSRCGLPFCSKHLLGVEGGERMCPTCVEKSGARVVSGPQSAVEQERRRTRYYRDYDYYPYYYHDYYYSPYDYGSVDGDASSGGEGDPDGGADAAEDYDYTES